MGILDYLSEQELEEDLRETIDLNRESVFSRTIEDYYLLNKSARLDTIYGHPVCGFDYIKKTSGETFWKGAVWLDTASANSVHGTRLVSPIRKIVTDYPLELTCYYSDGHLDSVIEHMEMNVDIFTYKTKTVGYRTLRDFWAYRPE